jgi:uncharacterized damage-inducible protein DinB
MKKLVFLPIALLFFSFLTADNTLTQKERKFATDLLKETENGVEAAVSGLTEAQLNFKPAPDKWSVADCVKHIAASEKMLREMLDGGLKQPANPEKRSEVKATDEQIVKKMEDRSTKVKTVDPLKPENTGFKTAEEALASFRENRESLIKFINETQDDMRNHVLALPMGTMDSYQVVLFIAAHSNRHLQQINEVKADPNFPK